MSYTELTQEISANIKSMREQSPDLIKSFNALSQAAMKDGILDAKTKELIALAIGVANRCDGCIGFHVKALVRLGATREELNEVLNMCVYLGGGPSLMYAANVLAAFDEFSVAS